MKTKEELRRLSKQVPGFNRGGMKSALSRGLPFYGLLRREYPRHFAAFSSLHKRVELGRSTTDLPRNSEGFIQFLLEIGDLPVDMRKPSVGRKDHDLGYVRGNYEWQSLSDNSKEVQLRMVMVGRHNSYRRADTAFRRRLQLKAMVWLDGSLGDKDCCRVLKVTNRGAFDIVSAMINEGKLKARLFGSRRAGWSLGAIA